MTSEEDVEREESSGVKVSQGDPGIVARFASLAASGSAVDVADRRPASLAVAGVIDACDVKPIIDDLRAKGPIGIDEQEALDAVLRHFARRMTGPARDMVGAAASEQRTRGVPALSVVASGQILARATDKCSIRIFDVNARPGTGAPQVVVHLARLRVDCKPPPEAKAADVAEALARELANSGHGAHGNPPFSVRVTHKGGDSEIFIDFGEVGYQTPPASFPLTPRIIDNVWNWIKEREPTHPVDFQLGIHARGGASLPTRFSTKEAYVDSLSRHIVALPNGGVAFLAESDNWVYRRSDLALVFLDENGREIAADAVEGFHSGGGGFVFGPANQHEMALAVTEDGNVRLAFTTRGHQVPYSAHCHVREYDCLGRRTNIGEFETFLKLKEKYERYRRATALQTAGDSMIPEA